MSTDLEHGFADDTEGVAETARLAVAAGLAGFSIEDSTGRKEDPIFEIGRAVERMAARPARSGRGHPPAPGLLDEVRRLVDEVDHPVNVLAFPNAPSVEQLASVGVARISIGGAFAFAADGALVEAATEFRDQGTYGFWDRASVGSLNVRTPSAADGGVVLRLSPPSGGAAGRCRTAPT